MSASTAQNERNKSVHLNKSRLAVCLVALTLILTASCLVLIPTGFVVGTPTKIQHLIFIIQENHSFDNYFGTYPGANGFTPGLAIPINPAQAGSQYVAPYHLNVAQPIMIVGDELPPGVSDPDQLDSGDSSGVSPFPFNNESIGGDLSHAWKVAHMAYDNGKMDGFIAAEKSTLTMGYYDRADIPYYWGYADRYVLDDDFFSSQMGPSFQNHLYIASGTSGPVTNLNYRWILNGHVVDNPAAGFNWQGVSLDWSTLAEEMSNSNVPWAWYDGEVKPLRSTIWDVLPLFTYFQNHPDQLNEHVQNAQRFIDAIQNAQLPAVSWIIPGSWVPPTYPIVCKHQVGGSPSEHPPARSDCGMDYVAYLVNQVMQSQYWQSSAIIITWDDYGGFYDHVPPPQIDAFGEGFRVPTLVVSPWAKHGFIDHTQYEFASFLKLAEVNFNIPGLGTRDVGASDMMNSFDFNQPPQPTLIEPANFVGPAQSSATTTTAAVPEMPSGVLYALVVAVVATAVVTATVVTRLRNKPAH